MKKTGIFIISTVLLIFQFTLIRYSYAISNEYSASKNNKSNGSLNQKETENSIFDLDPTIQLSEDTLNFESLTGSNPSPNTNTITITNTGGGTLNWKGSHNGGSWVTISPLSGSLTAGQSENLTVTIFATGEANLYQADISIADTNATNSPQIVHINYHEFERPSIAVNPDTLNFESFVGENPSQNVQNFTITNPGGSDLNWTGTHNDGGWLNLSPESGSLQPGQSESVSVTITATGSANDYQADISIADTNATNSPQIVHINYHEMVRPSIVVNPDTLNFESFVGENPAPNVQNFTISNSGGSDLNWNGTHSGGEWLNLSPESGSIQPGQSESVAVTITASGSANDYEADISIADANADNSPQTVHINYHEMERPSIAVNPDTLNFESFVGVNPSPNVQNFTITNPGGSDLNWNGTHNGDNWLSFSPESGSLQPGQSESVSVTITATGAANDYEADISIADANANNSPQNVHVNYNEIARPSIAVNTDTLKFESFVGENPSPNVQNFTITNPGDSDLNWSSTHNGGNWLSLSPESGSLQPGQSESVSVTITATGSANNYQADISIADANADNSPQTVHINYHEKGRPVIAITPDSLKFQSFLGVNPSPDNQSFTVTNNGGSDLNWFGLKKKSDWLAFSSSSGILSPGQSATVLVTVSAKGIVNTYEADITITDPNAGNSPQVVRITYMEMERPSISINPDTLNFESKIGVDPSPDTQIFTLTNNDGSDLNWAAVHDGGSWLSFTPNSGSLAPGQSETISVTVTATGSQGNYQADVTITDPDADNSPRKVHIKYREDDTVDVHQPAEIPTEFLLYANYPNPFNPQTTIQYDLPRNSHVRIVIYNLMGQKVKILIDEQKPAGSHHVVWNGKTEFGNEAPSGVYFYRFVAKQYSKTLKLTLMR